MIESADQLGPALRGLTSEWVRANHAFHDVIYRAAGAPLVASR